MALFGRNQARRAPRGWLDPSGAAEAGQVSRFGPDALNLVFRANGKVGERLVYRGDEAAFARMKRGRTYGFGADGAVSPPSPSEAYRIRLAYLFDPYLAVTASQIEALPHQIHLRPSDARCCPVSRYGSCSAYDPGRR